MTSLYGIGDAGFFSRRNRGRLGSTWRRGAATPILLIDDGTLEPVAKAETPHDIERRMVEQLRTSVDTDTPVIVGVSHAAAKQSASGLRDLIEREFDVLETLNAEIGPLLGSRTGPGSVSATVFTPEPDEVTWIQPIGDLRSDFL